ncbi:hypothetical protein GCM10027429_13560 [Marivirga atlantica]
MNKNIDAQIHTIDRVVDHLFAKKDSQRFLIKYIPLLENGKFRNYILEEQGDSLLNELENHDDLKEIMISNLLVANNLEKEELASSRHIVIKENQSIDSAIRITNLNYIGELGLSEVSKGNFSLLYIELVSPNHYKGVTRFLLMQKVDNEWITKGNFEGIQISTDTSDFQ